MPEATIFAAALEKASGDERAAFLAEACAGDEKVRRRVEALLRAHAEPDEILDAPSPRNGTIDYAPITEKPGTLIGPYKLKEQIGEGGFGLVFVAEQQEPVKRKVALKVIKPGMDTREVMARFTAERQALALMDHPNIARVLDAGATESGRPYFVMELVRGIPITDYCDQNQLSPRDRLDLFITVCQAVQHAHQKGIIHRDIKPSNVLVTSHDGKPVAKVIDFGVAKAINQQLTERSIYTNFAQMIGTPLYMSPEQAEMSGLDIDTRSDIYSLGVLLYELLTGTTPFDKKRFAKAAYDEIRRMIREDEPQKPSTRLSTSESIASIAAQRHTEPAKLSKLMRGDLDWITMKALEKDRTRRYETANGLARDIQRYLSDEPVEASPPSATYRLRKFARKNRAALTTTVAIALLLVAGIAVSSWQAIRATRAESDARASAEAERLAKQIAEEQKKKAIRSAEREADERKKAEAARDRMAMVLDDMTSDITGDSMATQREITEEQKRFLTQVLTYYKELIDEKAADERSRLRVARAATRVAKIEYRFLRGDQAIAANRLAIERFAALVADFPMVVEYRSDLAKAHTAQGLFFTDHEANHAEAHKHVLAAFAIVQRLANEFPEVTEYRKELVQLHWAQYLGQLRFGQKETAREHLRRMLVVQQGLVAELAVQPHKQVEFAEALTRLGGLLVWHGNPMEGEQAFRQALAIQLQLVAAHPNSTEHQKKLGTLFAQFGAALIGLGKPAEAEGFLRKRSAHLEKALVDFPAEPTLRSSLAGTHSLLGEVLKTLGRPPEAAEHYRNAVAIREKLVADLPKRSHYRWLLGGLYNEFGDFVRDTGKLEDCLAWYDKAIRTLAPIVMEKPASVLSVQDTVTSHRNRARVLSRLNRHAEALTDWNRIVELSDKDELRSARANRAYARVIAGETDAAIEEANELLVWQEWNAGEWYNFASMYAIASSKIADKKQEYADRAMELLRMAVKAGNKDAAHMKKDTDLDPLREREDFKKLISELEKK